MKRIFLLLLISTLGVQAFAGHYKKEGSIASEKVQYTFKDARLAVEGLKSTGPYLVFEQEEGNKLLGTDSKINEYIGASGKSHQLTRLFSIYENRALAASAKGNFSFMTNHDTDVIVFLSKKGNTYVIDIYTGDDALKKKAALKK